MKIIFLSPLLLFSFYLNAQYYYNDITGTEETNRLMQTYLANKVKMASAEGYTPQGSKATDFSEVQELKENGKTLKITTIANLNRTVHYNRFDEKNRLISITDSSLGIQNITTYEYDINGKISKVQNSVNDSASEISQVEQHLWMYNKDGKVEKMWRITNGTDSLEIRFIYDEKGNPGEEVSYRKGTETDRLYYYFDEQGRITDIVRYNEKIKKLVPDNIISYDDSGRVVQIITSTPGDKYGRITWVGYQIWRYVYNEKGLKTAEALFNNAQEMTGRIRYTYTFGQ
ncbi:MAG: hypothetical protein HZB42_13800 [Sphingobacteriales bacterium]|nr:hypothetical protein [Sphingobacteriales bacterium]